MLLIISLFCVTELKHTLTATLPLEKQRMKTKTSKVFEIQNLNVYNHTLWWPLCLIFKIVHCFQTLTIWSQT